VVASPKASFSSCALSVKAPSLETKRSPARRPETYFNIAAGLGSQRHRARLKPALNRHKDGRLVLDGLNGPQRDAQNRLRLSYADVSGHELARTQVAVRIFQNNSRGSRSRCLIDDGKDERRHSTRAIRLLPSSDLITTAACFLNAAEVLLVNCDVCPHHAVIRDCE